MNLNKCIFFAAFGILLGHIVCKEGMLVYPANIVIIVDLPTPITLKQLRGTLVHIGYHNNFIRGYAEITTPMEKLLKKYAKFKWNDKFQKSLDILKKKMVASPILVFIDWKKELHVHIDSPSISLGVILA